MPSAPDADIRAPATLLAVRELAAWLCSRCRAAGVDEALASELELALVEAANNIIEHGFAGAEGELGLSVDIEPGAVTMMLIDDGPAAPPGLFDTTAAPPDPLAEEGRGIAIMQGCLDEIAYRTMGASNVLTMIRRLAA